MRLDEMNKDDDDDDDDYGDGGNPGLHLSTLTFTTELIL